MIGIGGSILVMIRMRVILIWKTENVQIRVHIFADFETMFRLYFLLFGKFCKILREKDDLKKVRDMGSSWHTAIGRVGVRFRPFVSFLEPSQNFVAICYWFYFRKNRSIRSIREGRSCCLASCPAAPYLLRPTSFWNVVRSKCR